MLNDVNFLLQEVARETTLEVIDIEYEAMMDEYLCKWCAEYTMDDVGCEFDR
jgi:hypothetical protein